MIDRLPEAWRTLLAPEFAEPYWPRLEEFVARERAGYDVFPPEAEVFRALELTPLEGLSVVVLGQDPYPGEGQAHGLAFSVRPGVAVPRSLKNIFRELHDDLGIAIPNHGNLESWARQAVLLLNTVLTVRSGAANSHASQGWENFTDAVIHAANARADVVFVLWGQNAQRKIGLIDDAAHTVIRSAHPSPLSARNGFFGSKPFSRINTALRASGRPEIDWQLPAQP